jgi:NADPH:quinone reductase-like Zn-dependent oxidoreductase
MLAEEVVLAEQAWVAMPADYSFEEAATLPCAAVTAWNALFVGAQLKPGDHVLVQGTGGVSIFALQLAKAAGARVLVTSSSAEKRAIAARLGADHTIDYRAETEWGELARAWSGGRGVDVVVEVGGPGTFDQSSLALRYGGTMSLLGVLTGLQGSINTHRVFHRNLRVAGIYVGSTEMFEDLVRALSANRIRPVIDRSFSFEEAKAAYAHLQGASHVGKVVVRV